MFIRRSPTRSRKAGGTYSSFRLVRNVRTPGGVRQQTLLNLGADFAVPRQQWPDLLAILEDLRDHRIPLVEPDPQLHQLALHLHHRLAERLPAAPGDDLASVHLDTLDNAHTRSVGGERIALHALEQLRLVPTLQQQGLSQRRANLAAALIVARMLQPSSERAACEWLNHSSATLELLALETGKPLELNNLYRISDQLWKYREELHAALSERSRGLFQHPDSIVFIDLTNVHYHGAAGGDRQFGRSKQRRNDCPLVSLGLSLDEGGFPLRSEVLPGNVSEPCTLADALAKLSLQAGAKPTVILDAGLSTADNLAWLRQQGYHWITVERGKQAPPQEAAAASFRTRKDQLAEVWQLSGEADGELRLCVRSEGRRAKEEEMLQRQRERFEAALRALHEGLSKPRCTKRYERVTERLGRLKERHKQVASQYEVSVVMAADADAGDGAKTARKGRRRPRPSLAAAVQWRPKDKHALLSDAAGTYLLRTSRTDWDLQRIVQTYW